MANRLQNVIQSIIHENQYGFIKSRTIHDRLAWAYEYLHHCSEYKKEVAALKLDFEKYFDKVDHSFILDILQAKGFGPLWCKWIKKIIGFCYLLSAAQ
jgi:retron-type reverse transcriptase